jgi:tRNA(fMet)-specific endonuclease VapC
MTVASPGWLLDTNILSHAMRFPTSPLAIRIQRLSAETPARICTSLVVECEMAFGLAKLGPTRQASVLSAKIATMLQFVRPMAMDTSLTPHYASIRAHLESQGTPIGPNDTLIAAHALALDCTLVTDNETEFRRVPGLRVENWLLPQTAAEKASNQPPAH